MRKKRNRKTVRTSIVLLAAVVAAVTFGTGGCGEHSMFSRAKAEKAEDALAIINSDLNAGLCEDPLDSMPDDGCQKIKINGLGGPLAKVFNDSNYIHYAAAEEIGITPIENDGNAWKPGRELERVRSCKEFYVTELKHSHPYLIPEAHELLKEIGRRFNDSLQARGGGDYRLKITSLLRTSESVKRLRRVNRCAVDSSTHRFGTTFDISYTRFMLTKREGVYRTQEDLKNLLAEVVHAVRKEGKCFVKYERKSGCFHITARKRNA